jgi:hypothetical protein
MTEINDLIISVIKSEVKQIKKELAKELRDFIKNEFKEIKKRLEKEKRLNFSFI